MSQIRHILAKHSAAVRLFQPGPPHSPAHCDVRPLPGLDEVTRAQLTSLRLDPEAITRRSPSVTDDSMVSDSNYDSGAFSRTSTPELGPAMRNKLSEVAPLLSPPLVLSVSRRSHNPTPADTNSLSDTLPLRRPHLDTLHEARASPVTVSIGVTTRLCVNDEEEPREAAWSQYQSLPNLSRSDTRLVTRPRVSPRPRMGTSRLLTPPKPARVRSVIINNHNSSLERPRSRITTSTSVLLNRSNTSVGFNSAVNLNKYRLGPEATEPLSPVMRGVRDNSCGSDTSSGVFSAASLETHNRVHSCKVTVNGQHL